MLKNLFQQYKCFELIK